MDDFHSAPAVVVGIDGSPAASGAAVWAVDEAASRAIPLKLVYVIYSANLPGTDIGYGTDQFTAATALSDARRAVETAARSAHKPVRIETEVLSGNPLTTLIGLSRSATMVCVGSIGVGCACHRAGSTAAALAGSAPCPVAVVRRQAVRQRGNNTYVVAEVDPSADNNDVLRWAMTEARLRGAPLRVIGAWRPQSDARGTADAVRAQLDRRVASWARRYPDVAVESVAVRGSVPSYLAEHAESVELFVSGTRDLRSLGRPGGDVGYPVLTVAGARL